MWVVNLDPIKVRAASKLALTDSEHGMAGLPRIRCQDLAPLKPDTSYETAPIRNSEKIERRTSNVQHRTSNIYDATLYRF